MAYNYSMGQDKLEPLVWSKELANAAKDKCEYLGMNGKIQDPVSLFNRLKKYTTTNYNLAQNIVFGPKKGILSLYVDDGYTERPHRRHIINPLFRYTGIAACDHQIYGKMLVIVYAEGVKAPVIKRVHSIMMLGKDELYAFNQLNRVR